MLDQFRDKDVIIVTRLDRLARSTKDLLDGDGQKPWFKRTSPVVSAQQITLAANVSTIFRWRARPDDGERSGR